jgi:modulator of FtsH protease HflK
MSDDHEHHHHEHEHEHDAPDALDAGSQALAEALRSSFAIVKIVMLLMVIAFFGSGFFQVGPAEKAVILRFGKPVGVGQKMLLNPGLHWSFPYPIDEVVKIPYTEIQKVSSNNGWYFTTPEQELSGEELPPGASLNPAIDGFVLTSDRNIIHTRATLSYHIADPIQYVFHFQDASNAVQNALDNALLYTAAQFGVDDALITGVAQFHDAVLARVSDLVEQENLGIAIDQCEVQSIPPRQLTDIFAQVTIARENRDKLLNDAHSYANQILSQADAQALSITNEAESARALYVDSLKAEAKRFTDLLPKYELDPSLFEQQTFVEMIGPTLTNVEDKWFLPQSPGGKSSVIRLMLNREPPQPKPSEQNQ